MHTERKDGEHGTEIAIWSEGDASYRITCMDFDRDGEVIPPTPHVLLLTSHRPTPADVRRLATEYAYVADVAEALQAEKRAAFEKR